VLEQATGIADRGAETERHRLKMGIDALATGRRQGIKQLITPQAIIDLRLGHLRWASMFEAVASPRAAREPASLQ
jgi:hypothetical protein